jgi:hypothetical protein
MESVLYRLRWYEHWHYIYIVPVEINSYIQKMSTSRQRIHSNLQETGIANTLFVNFSILLCIHIRRESILRLIYFYRTMIYDYQFGNLDF